MKIDEYKLTLEVSNLDETIVIADLSTRIDSIELYNLEEYRIKYNGTEFCSGSFYGEFLSFIFDGDVYQIDLNNQTSFSHIVEEILSIININLCNIDLESKRFLKYKDVCTSILNTTKSSQQDHKAHE